MKTHAILIVFICTIFSCKRDVKISSSVSNEDGIKVVGAMRNVMLKGELFGRIDIDTIRNRKNLYGFGPAEYLTGELLIVNGKSYVSKVLPDSTMIVEETYKVKAPFFAYDNITDFEVEDLPASIRTISQLEEYINHKLKNYNKAIFFKISDTIESAIIHTLNLPEGTEVKSHNDAHQGKVSFEIRNKKIDIIGFFSREHTGIFTHHDSNLHMHLISKDPSMMGHLDKAHFSKGAKIYFNQNDIIKNE